MGGHIPRLNASGNGDEDIQAVWVDKDARDVAIYYSSGIRLFEAPQDETSAQQKDEYQGVVDQNGGASQLAEFDGVPALVTTRDFQGSGTCGTPGIDCIPAEANPSDVTLQVGGYGIELDAYMATTDLEAAANSIK